MINSSGDGPSIELTLDITNALPKELSPAHPARYLWLKKPCHEDCRPRIHRKPSRISPLVMMREGSSLMVKLKNGAGLPESKTDSGGPSVRKVFSTFLHLGLTAYGGLAMVEPIRRRIVQERAGSAKRSFWMGWPSASCCRGPRWCNWQLTWATVSAKPKGRWPRPPPLFSRPLSSCWASPFSISSMAT